MKLISNQKIKNECKHKLKCVTGVKKKCQCEVVGEMANKKRKEFTGYNLAKKILDLQESITDLKKKGINDRAILVLLHDATKLPMKQITEILDAIQNIKTLYCEVPKRREP